VNGKKKDEIHVHKSAKGGKLVKEGHGWKPDENDKRMATEESSTPAEQWSTRVYGKKPTQIANRRRCSCIASRFAVSFYLSQLKISNSALIFKPSSKFEYFKCIIFI
jgi:hypothetical protein